MSYLTQTADLTTSLVNGTFNPLDMFGITLNQADVQAVNQINTNINQAKPQFQSYNTSNTKAKTDVRANDRGKDPTTDTATQAKTNAFDWGEFGKKYFWWIAVIGFVIIAMMTGFFGLVKKG